MQSMVRTRYQLSSALFACLAAALLTDAGWFSGDVAWDAPPPSVPSEESSIEQSDVLAASRLQEQRRSEARSKSDGGACQSAVGLAASDAQVISKPVPLMRSTWVRAEDYPVLALREEQAGTTAVMLAISSDGSVTRCGVVESSGYASLDVATCASLRRSARFSPALDSRGCPIPSQFRQRVRWALPL
jgi:TonB family protein